MPNFVSPGAMAGNAIERFLMQREMENRQRMLDELTQQRQAGVDEDRKRQIGLDERQFGLRERELAADTAARQQTQADLETERGFRRATTISNAALPGDPVDEATRGVLEQHGYGGQIRKVPGIIAQGPLQSTDEQDIPTYGVTQTPDSYTMRGGSQYLSQRAAAEERAGQADESRLARDAAADEQRAFQAGQNQLSRENTRAIAGMGAGLRADAAQTKVDAAKKVEDEKRATVATTRADVRELAQSILDDPALDGVTGPIEGRRETFYQGKNVDVMRRLKQLTDKLSLEARGKLKGQGAVSDFEGRMLASSASAIDRAAGPEIVRKHVKAIVDTFTGNAPSNGPGGEDDDALLDELLRGGR